MRWMVACAALAIAGCDVEAGPHDHEPVSTSFMGDEPDCPEATIARGDAPPVGYALWCELPSGTAHGYRVEWYVSGNMRARETWAHGRRHGLLQRWYESGQMERQVEFRDGTACGIDLRWTSDGTAMEPIELDPCSPL